MTKDDEKDFLVKNKFKAGRTWYNAFMERNGLKALARKGTKEMTTEVFVGEMNVWLPKERYELLKDFPNLFDRTGYIDVKRVFNADQVPLQLVKDESKQTVNPSAPFGADTTVVNRTTTASVHHQIATLMLTTPMSGWVNSDLERNFDCRPFMIIKGL